MDLSKVFGLPGFDDRNFVTGFLLPVLLAAIAIAWTFPDFPGLEPLRSLPTTPQALSQIAYLALAIWVAAFILQNTNEFQHRLLEGYLPPVSWLFLSRKIHRRRMRNIKQRCDDLWNEWKIAIANDCEFSKTKMSQYARLHSYLLAHYPTYEEEILPTRFGNSIRAFEIYPREVYGVDSVPIMLRLNGVIPNDFSSRISAARAQVDFCVNLVFLATIIILIALIRVAEMVKGSDLTSIAPDSGGMQFLRSSNMVIRPTIAIGFGLLIAFMGYKAAIFRVRFWGDLIKSAFDLYLPELQKQMGYVMPQTEAEQREFWGEISALIAYQQPMTSGRWRRIGETANGSSEAQSPVVS